MDASAGLNAFAGTPAGLMPALAAERSAAASRSRSCKRSHPYVHAGRLAVSHTCRRAHLPDLWDGSASCLRVAW